MATNKPTINALKRMTELIDGLNANCSKEVIDELIAWNRLLKVHIGQQKKQGGLWEQDCYEYDPNTKKINRIRKGKIVHSH